MVLTATFLICKALGVTWSWWWLALTILADAKPMITYKKEVFQ